MTSSFFDGFLFLINTLFDLYLFMLVIRVILVWIGANYFDPLTQFVIRCTDFIIKPLRKKIPNIRHIETATVLLILVIELIKYFLVLALSFGMPNLIGLLIIVFGDIIKLVVQTFFYTILVQAVMTWIQPSSPVNHLLYQITAPIMRPIQRILPPMGGIDISPIPALILLQLLLIVLATPIMSAGLRIAMAG